MAVVKLTDIVPLTYVPDTPKNKKKQQARKRSPRQWLNEFKEFLKFCGWTEDDDGELIHPSNFQVRYDGAGLFYDTLGGYLDFEIGSNNADSFLADDESYELYSENKLDLGTAFEKIVIKLK